LASPCYSQRAVFASLCVLFFIKFVSHVCVCVCTSGMLAGMYSLSQNH